METIATRGLTCVLPLVHITQQHRNNNKKTKHRTTTKTTTTHGNTKKHTETPHTDQQINNNE